MQIFKKNDNQKHKNPETGDKSRVIGSSHIYSSDEEANQMCSYIFSKPEYKNKLIIPGHVPENDLAALYSKALVLVMPSIMEGFGLPPLEAMQCGTPVITSNTSSFPEVVGDAGIMVDPHDVDAISQNILKLYKDENLCQKLKNKGIERAKLFSWEKHYDTILTGFLKLSFPVFNVF